MRNYLGGFCVKRCTKWCVLCTAVRCGHLAAHGSYFARKMKLLKALIVLSVLITAHPAGAQAVSLEVSDIDGIPVLVKHLPDWESKRGETVFARDPAALSAAVGARPVIGLIDFRTGTEAVSAPYEAGRLLILEYTNPQSSLEDDAKFVEALNAAGGATVYRRIGNYNAFVFDVNDEAAANALLDQIKYEKNVQWLGDDPFLLRRAERRFVITTADIFLSTLFWILGGVGLAIITGIGSGFLFYRIREQRRRALPTFSDAGGMTRLNLDGFTAEPDPKYILSD